jgi:hypothetical protein
LLVPGYVGAEDVAGDDTVAHEQTHVIMHKNPGCGCCDKWADHMRSYGFSVSNVEDAELFAFKEEKGIPQPLMSCHTAIVDGYFIEGHVPASDVLRLLRDRPQHVSGIAVPAMPLGSPGMEHPRPQPFKTIALLSDGSAYVFADHAAGEDFSKSNDAAVVQPGRFDGFSEL